MVAEGAGTAYGMDDDDEDAFDTRAWIPELQQYGLFGMLHVREAMMPIEKPEEVKTLKFLICPDASPEEEGDRDRLKGRERRVGKGRDGKGKEAPVGRFIPEMGRTELMPRPGRGTWWRNCGANRSEVIIREQFLLTSEEITRVPYGQYVLQAGPLEVFVSGPAQGLQRMPVQPRGWVTVDATSVGGPLYLEKVKQPLWQVVFSSGSAKGDIVVRKAVSLDSDEVAVLTCGTVVEQGAPLEETEDGIIRMPILLSDNMGREQSSSSQPARGRSGWVTCDATAQGGPKFFEPVNPHDESQKPGKAEDGDRADEGTWDANRTWRVMNLQEDSQELPMVNRCEPYAPGSGKIVPEEILVRHLQNGDLVHQVGHSKKIRGYMVMPIRIGEDEGWVVRRLVDRARDHGYSAPWFEELVNGEPREQRRHRHRDRDGKAD
mmetsp:Transcript_4235/g.9762  ORF Transcript_4235/g.9762 Transcript_4235/m.9762 type:complete len:433 (+) Transcript_4235:46-1344(+)